MRTSSLSRVLLAGITFFLFSTPIACRSQFDPTAVVSGTKGSTDVSWPSGSGDCIANWGFFGRGTGCTDGPAPVDGSGLGIALGYDLVAAGMGIQWRRDPCGDQRLRG